MKTKCETTLQTDVTYKIWRYRTIRKGITPFDDFSVCIRSSQLNPGINDRHCPSCPLSMVTTQAGETTTGGRGGGKHPFILLAMAVIICTTGKKIYIYLLKMY